jgi:hypothetical protein
MKNNRICKINLENSIVSMSQIESDFETCFEDFNH